MNDYHQKLIVNYLIGKNAVNTSNIIITADDRSGIIYPSNYRLTLILSMAYYCNRWNYSNVILLFKKFYNVYFYDKR